MSTGAHDRHPRTLTRQVALAALVLGLLQVAVFAAVIGAVRSASTFPCTSRRR
jgi:hypothetical protein